MAITWGHTSHYLHSLWGNLVCPVVVPTFGKCILRKALLYPMGFYKISISQPWRPQPTLSTGSLSKSSWTLLLFQHFSMHTTKHYFDTQISPVKPKLLFSFLWFFLSFCLRQRYACFPSFSVKSSLIIENERCWIGSQDPECLWPSWPGSAIN